METISSPPRLIAVIRPSARGTGALETIKRLIALLGSPPIPPSPAPETSKRPKLVLLKGGK